MLEYLIPSFLNMEFCYQKVKGALLSEKADAQLSEENSPFNNNFFCFLALKCAQCIENT